MTAITNNDEVFGLPFLFTGGLPTSLEKFKEANLRCFLAYLIEVSCKANRLNVWRKPLWWNSKLLPYSPLEIDANMVAPARVKEELQNLVISCYKFYKAERILEVSKQLSEIPRMLLAVRDNGDGTKTFYSSQTKVIYVTVTNGNLTYDDASLNKVSLRVQDNSGRETYCEIDQTQQVGEVCIYKLTSKMTNALKQPDAYPRKRPAGNGVCSRRSREAPPQPKADVVTIEIDDEDEDEDKDIKRATETHQLKEELKVESNSPGKKLSNEKQSWGVCKMVEKDGGYIRIIDLVDSSDEMEDGSSTESEDEVQFVAEFINTKPGPRCYKEKQLKMKQLKKEEDCEVIVLSDGEESSSSRMRILNSFSLTESPSCYDGRKSILEPLLRSPSKVREDISIERRTSNMTPRKQFHALSPFGKSSQSPIHTAKPTCPVRGKMYDREISNLDIDCEGWSLAERRKRFQNTRPDRLRSRAYPLDDPVQLSPLTSSTKRPFIPIKRDYFKNILNLIPREDLHLHVKKSVTVEPDLSCVTRKCSWRKVPLDWLAMFGKKVVFRKWKEFGASNFEEFCTTDPFMVSCSIRQSLSMKDPTEIKKKQPKDSLSTDLSLGRWYFQQQEISRRRRRASVRAARAQLGSSPSTLEFLHCSSSLVPYLEHLPPSIIRRAFMDSVSLSTII